MQNYTQCKLTKPDGSFDTCWIPSEFAKKGKALKIRVDGEWQTGWKVDETYATKSADWLLDHGRDYLTQRQASDI